MKQSIIILVITFIYCNNNVDCNSDSNSTAIEPSEELFCRTWYQFIQSKDRDACLSYVQSKLDEIVVTNSNHLKDYSIVCYKEIKLSYVTCIDLFAYLTPFGWDLQNINMFLKEISALVKRKGYGTKVEFVEMVLQLKKFLNFIDYKSYEENNLAMITVAFSLKYFSLEHITQSLDMLGDHSKPPSKSSADCTVAELVAFMHFFSENKASKNVDDNVQPETVVTNLCGDKRKTCNWRPPQLAEISQMSKRQLRQYSQLEKRRYLMLSCELQDWSKGDRFPIWRVVQLMDIPTLLNDPDYTMLPIIRLLLENQYFYNFSFRFLSKLPNELLTDTKCVKQLCSLITYAIGNGDIRLKFVRNFVKLTKRVGPNVRDNFEEGMRSLLYEKHYSLKYGELYVMVNHMVTHFFTTIFSIPPLE